MAERGDKSDRVGEMPIVVWHVGNVIQKLMDDAQPRITQTKLAELTGLARNTISDLIRNASEAEQGTIERVADALNTTRGALMGMVDRLNGEDNVLPMPRREQREREEDRDTDVAEALQYGKRLAKLPRIARLAIFNTIQAFEDFLNATKPRL